jgi:hypothetical protein
MAKKSKRTAKAAPDPDIDVLLRLALKARKEIEASSERAKRAIADSKKALADLADAERALKTLKGRNITPRTGVGMPGKKRI